MEQFDNSGNSGTSIRTRMVAGNAVPILLCIFILGFSIFVTVSRVNEAEC